MKKQKLYHLVRFFSNVLIVENREVFSWDYSKRFGKIIHRFSADEYYTQRKGTHYFISNIVDQDFDLEALKERAMLEIL